MSNKGSVSSLRDEHFKTRSGICLKRAYRPEDIEDIHYSTEIGEPGQFPYTRGIYPEMYRAVGWMKRQPMGFGSSMKEVRRSRCSLICPQITATIRITPYPGIRLEPWDFRWIISRI